VKASLHQQVVLCNASTLNDFLLRLNDDSLGRDRVRCIVKTLRLILDKGIGSRRLKQACWLRVIQSFICSFLSLDYALIRPATGNK
jgi:hypothetical protein